MMNEGQRLMLPFKNGYSASIVCTPYSYGGSEGLFEIAVFKNNNINYSTEITNDVMGYLTGEEVLETLNKIASLDQEGKLPVCP